MPGSLNRDCEHQDRNEKRSRVGKRLPACWASPFGEPDCGHEIRIIRARDPRFAFPPNLHLNGCDGKRLYQFSQIGPIERDWTPNAPSRVKQFACDDRALPDNVDLGAVVDHTDTEPQRPCTMPSVKQRLRKMKQRFLSSLGCSSRVPSWMASFSVFLWLGGFILELRGSHAYRRLSRRNERAERLESI